MTYYPIKSFARLVIWHNRCIAIIKMLENTSILYGHQKSQGGKVWNFKLALVMVCESE